jgi:hypothetical protein
MMILLLYEQARCFSTKEITVGAEMIHGGETVSGEAV